MATATPSIIKVGSTLTVVMSGQVYTVDQSVKNYPMILQAIKDRDWDGLRDQLDIAASLIRRSGGRAEVVDGVVFLDGMPVRNVIADRILGMVEEGFNVDPMLRFLENLHRNPTDFAREELYLFLETNRLPITEDGHFLAYKVVREDYLDCHSGTIRNMIGDKPTMDRAKVDPDRHRTCSAGLHFCSLGYIGHFGGGNSRLMIVKINPADVVSIPSDYDNTKGRCWTYEVVDEIQRETAATYDQEAPAVSPLLTPFQAESKITLDFIFDMWAEVLGGDVDYMDVDDPIILDGEYGHEDVDTDNLPGMLVRLGDAFGVTIFEAGDSLDPFLDMTFEGLLTMVMNCRRSKGLMETTLRATTPTAVEEDEAEPTIYDDFGVKEDINGPGLRALREKCEVSRLALADEMGIARGTVWSYEESLATKPETSEKYLRALRNLI